MRFVRSLLLALTITVFGLCVLVGVTRAQAPGEQDLPLHPLPPDQVEAPAPFDPAAPNQLPNNLTFLSPQAAVEAFLPTPSPTMRPQLMDLVGTAGKTPQDFPWQASEIVYDGAQLCDEQQSPDIAMDSAGNAYAVWQDCRNANGSSNRDIYFAYRLAGGSWGANVKVNDDSGSAAQGEPAIAVDEAGNAYAVWMDQRNGNGDIYFAYRSAGGSWGTNIKVNDGPTSASQSAPDIAVDAAGNAYAVWEDSRSGISDIYFAYRPASGSWGSSIKVNDDLSGDGHNRPAIAVDGTGNAYAAWDDHRDWNDIYFAYRPAGGSWSANIKVNDDLGNALSGPALTVDGSGNAYAAWEDSRNGNSDIYFAYRPVGGSWGINQRVNDDAGSAGQSYPSLAIDGAGDAYAVWHDGRNGNSAVYSAYRPAGGSWSANQRVDDNPGGAYQSPLAIAVDGAGNAYAVWRDNRNDNGDIYFAHRPAGSSWGANQRVNDDPGSAYQTHYRGLAVDGAGNAYAVWQDDRNDSGDIYFAHRPSGGSWGANVKVNDDPGIAGQSRPALAVDAAGNAYAIWLDHRNGSDDIFFAYRPIGGGWGANVKVNDDSGNSGQSYPALVVDAAGNAYAIWQDYRYDGDIYFAYRPAGGSWGANVKVNDNSGSAFPSGPALAVDAAGNAYAVWMDQRNGNQDIYFAYRAASGSWGANIKVNDDSGNALQYTPDIAVDAAGNASAVWQDRRNGNGHIYFAYRPAAGSWGPNVNVNDGPASASQSSPALAIDAAGNASAVWQDSRNGNSDIYFAYRPAGGAWGANVKVSDDTGSALQFSPAIAVDTAGNAFAAWTDDRNVIPHIYFSHALHDDLPQRPPAPQITFPLPGAINQNSFAVQGLACADCQVSIYDGNVLLSTATATTNGLFSSPVTLANGSHTLTAVAQYILGPTPWPPSLPSSTVPLSVDSSLRIDPQRLTLAYTMWGGQTVVLRPRDTAGLLVSCTGAVSIPGFRIRPDLPNTLTVAVSGSPTHVQVVVAGVGVFDLAPIGGDVWETTFTVNAAHDLTIRISDDGGATFTNQCTGQVLIDPQGVVSNANTSQPIQGATVTCYVATEGGEWNRWPAENFDGQTNPQYTAASGFYAFFTPPGSYQIEAWAPGYIPQRTGTIVVTSQLVEVNLALQPLAAPCPADLNGDGEVSVSDLIAIADKWNAVSPNFPYAPGFDLMPVGAPDGAITIADIQYVAAHWGETCTP